MKGNVSSSRKLWYADGLGKPGRIIASGDNGGKAEIGRRKRGICEYRFHNANGITELRHLIEKDLFFLVREDEVVSVTRSRAMSVIAKWNRQSGDSGCRLHVNGDIRDWQVTRLMLGEKVRL